ncbi:XdhC/CoxI family protein [Microbacterium sp. BK668]|uniref:XdhC family protein n=1 Tax=Microbacterium sp. BK668 TaxID=2512118 RepID=UPI0010608FD6|nr:XdhC/CoxI family protein [Microbacterium sp. BK668]TDN90960.1 xanthine dehydrogenase accessory factor [Microbacterium sp. BK668]
MLESARDLLPVLRRGEDVAVVTVTRVARSAPRGVGASMAVTGDGAVIGSISGGCVEGESIALALAVLATGEARTASFGFSDETAHAAGLACGGSVEVIAYRVRATDAAARGALEDAAADRPVTIAIRDDGGVERITDGIELATPLGQCVAYRESRLLPGEHPTLVLSAAPRPRLLLVGAGEHAAALARIGSAAGWRVSVCDVWPLLVTPERFPTADEVVAAVPHEWLAALDPAGLDPRTAVCVLTHDERVDVPAIATALTLPVGFVGAMGARSTVAHRLRLLRERGLDEVTLARLHSPLGLDLGGSTPEESALSVLAEIVASRHGGSGAPLRERAGALHRRDEASVTREEPAEVRR